MKPIEIHIEGYKIVISEDKVTSGYKEVVEKAQPITVPGMSEPDWTKVYPTYPDSTSPQNPDWWRYPYVTWTGGDTTITNTTEYKAETPVRDTMVGKSTTEGNLISAIKDKLKDVKEDYQD